MNKSFYQFFIFLAGSFVCLYLAYCPAVNIPYTNHDSIRYFHKFYNHEEGSQTNPMYGYLKSDGRLITAELEELFYKNVNHLSDLSRLRLIVIIIIALCAALLITILQAGGMEAIQAFCLGTAVFTLPGFQDIVFVPYPSLGLAVFLSLLAYFISTNKMIYGIHHILALVLLEIVFFMYPPATFFFLIPAIFLVIFQHDRQNLKGTWGRNILLWLLASGIFYFILRVFYYAQLKLSGHQIAFTGKQILLNMTTFLPQVVPQIFNLWNVYYSQTLGICVLTLVAVSAAIDILVTKKMAWGKLFALIIFFFIFNLVWILFGGYMPRQFIAAQALALALVYWCGKRLGRLWPILFLCVGLIIANQMTSSNVLNNYSELMYMRSRLAQFVNSSTKEIHVIGLKDGTKGYNNLPRVYDNINGAINNYEVPDFIRVALKDMGDPFDLHCIVTFSNYGDPYQLLPNSVVIDMNDLVYISSPEKK